MPDARRLLLLATLAACGPTKPDQTTLDPADTTDSTGAPPATSSPDPTTGGGAESPPNPSAPPDPATSDPSSTTANPTTATDATTGDPAFCDVGLQDCPEGQKCNVFTDGQDNLFQGMFGCFPVDPDPQPPHAPCDVFGDPLDGTDNCELGAICLILDEGDVGECFSFCDFSVGPICDVPNDVCVGATCQTCTWSFCDANCDILDPASCDKGELCAPNSEAWTCVPDASGDDGQHGDPCEFVNDCDHGFVCMNPGDVPGCPGDTGCCAAACDVAAPETCPDQAMGVECTAWYAEGTAPSDELADLGVCIVP